MQGLYRQSALWIVTRVSVFMLVWLKAAAKDQQPSHFSLMDRAETWTDARAHCVSDGGKLTVVTDEQKLKRLLLATREKNDVGAIWIGRYLHNSPWIISKGCYSMVGNVSIQTKLGSDNDVFQCMASCPNTTYFAVQRETCHCLKARTLLRETRASRCNSVCPGSEEEFCGGRYYMSLYKKVRKLRIHDDNNESHCMAMTLHMNGSVTVVAKSCEDKLPYLCADTRSWISRWRLYQGDKQLSWKESVRSCRKLSRKLATHGDNNRYRWQQYMENGSFYWMAGFRESKMMWHYGQSKVADGKCVALLFNSSSQFRFLQDHCSSKKPYVCEREFINTNMTQESMLASPVSSPLPSSTVGVIVGTLALVLISGILLTVAVVLIFHSKRTQAKKIVQFERFSNSVSGNIYSSPEDHSHDGHYDEVDHGTGYMNHVTFDGLTAPPLQDSASTVRLCPEQVADVTYDVPDPNYSVPDTIYSSPDAVTNQYEDVIIRVYENENPVDPVAVIPNDYERLDRSTQHISDYDSLQFHQNCDPSTNLKTEPM